MEEAKVEHPMTDIDTAKELQDRGITYLSFDWNTNGEVPKLLITIPDTVGYAKWESLRGEFLAMGWLVTFIVK